MVKETGTIKCAAFKRNDIGSGPVNRLRKEGWLPAVVYSAGKPARSIKLNRHNLEMLVRHHGGHNLILDLEIEGEPVTKVLLKEIQHDRIRDRSLHADFLEVSLTRKIRVMVAVKLVGEPPGVTLQEGVLEHLIREVEVECLPMDIVKEFEVDVSGLNLGDSIFVNAIKVDPAKTTILTPGNITLASVLMPRIEEEVKPEEVVAAEGQQEPEVIGDKGKEKEEEDEEAPEKGKEGKEGKEKGKEVKEGKEKGKEVKEGKEKGQEIKEGKEKNKGAAAGGKEKVKVKE